MRTLRARRHLSSKAGGRHTGAMADRRQPSRFDLAAAFDRDLLERARRGERVHRIEEGEETLPAGQRLASNLRRQLDRAAWALEHLGELPASSQRAVWAALHTAARLVRDAVTVAGTGVRASQHEMEEPDTLTWERCIELLAGQPTRAERTEAELRIEQTRLCQSESSTSGKAAKTAEMMVLIAEVRRAARRWLSVPNSGDIYFFATLTFDAVWYDAAPEAWWDAVLAWASFDADGQKGGRPRRGVEAPWDATHNLLVACGFEDPPNTRSLSTMWTRWLKKKAGTTPGNR